MQKKLLLPLVMLSYLVLFPLAYLLFPVSAVSLSPSASPLASPKPSVGGSPSPFPASIDEITQNLKKRLQDSLVEESPSPLSSKRAFIGVVKDLIKDTLIIEDKDGKKDVMLQNDTVILRAPGNALIKPENIRIDDSIIAMGIPTGVDTLTALRLIVSADPIPTPNKSSGLGILTQLGKTTLTLKVGDHEEFLSLTSKTILKTPVNTLELTDLALGDTLVYTATLDAQDDATATLIMRIGSTSL